VVVGDSHEDRSFEPFVGEQPNDALESERDGGRAVPQTRRHGGAEHQNEERRGNEHRLRLRDIRIFFGGIAEPIAQVMQQQLWHASVSMPSPDGPMMIPCGPS
jgi:hypothetical protein